jgi:hypothetical protein
MTDYTAYTYSNGSAYPSNNASSAYAICPSSCQTADNWGADPQQCLLPGYGAPNLFIYNRQTGALGPTSYPVTYDQKMACEQVVFRSPLVNVARPSDVFGQIFVWKDYSDYLYITVSLNATGFGPTLASTPSAFGSNPGQFLFTSPSSFSPNQPSGTISIW